MAKSEVEVFGLDFDQPPYIDGLYKVKNQRQMEVLKRVNPEVMFDFNKYLYYLAVGKII